jgi:Tfp pilus assembly protein PilF
MNTRFRKTPNLIAAATALAAIALFLPALGNGLVDWDDPVYVVANLHIRSLDGAFLRWAFTDTATAGFWHPVTWISHALDYALWGPDPRGHHLTSIVLHGLNVFLFVMLALSLLRQAVRKEGEKKLDERSILFAAATAGLLFGIHPLRVESVAWVAERKDLLCAFFFLLSTGAYVRALTARPAEAIGTTGSLVFGRPYLLSLAFFALALMSKPMAVSLPAVLLVLDWHPFGRIRSMRDGVLCVAEKIPFIVMSLALSVVTLETQKAAGAMPAASLAPLGDRLLLAFRSLAMYLGKTVWPVSLSPLYPHPASVAALSLGTLAAIALVALITGGAILTARTRPFWLAVWASYVVMLLPVLGIVQVGYHAMADRFTYLPLLGPALLAGAGAAWLWQRRRAGLAAAGVIVVLGLSAATVRQIRVWRDSFTLWDTVIERAPGTLPIAYNYRGNAFREAGALDSALQDYDRAIALDPDYDEPYVNRAIVLQMNGRTEDAVADLTKAISLSPAYVNAYISRGYVLLQSGKLDAALVDLDRAIALGPDQKDAYLNRGVVHERQGRSDLAMEDYGRVIALDPRDALAFADRGRIRVRQGDQARGRADLERACELGSGEACAELQRMESRLPGYR